MTYDELGRLTRTTHPDGTFDETTYDAEGRRDRGDATAAAGSTGFDLRPGGAAAANHARATAPRSSRATTPPDGSRRPPIRAAG